MNLVLVLRLFAAWNLTLALAFLVLKSEDLLPSRWRRRLDMGTRRRLHLAGLVLALAAGAAVLAGPAAPEFEPVVKVWSASSLRAFSQPSSPGPVEAATLSVRSGGPSFPGRTLSRAAGIFLLLVTAAGLALLFRDLIRLRRLRRGSYEMRRLGAVRLYVNDRAAVPFSFWLPGRAEVYLPPTLLGSADDLRLTVAHELQHHRQGDTRAVYLFWALRTFFVLNPFAHFWIRRISALQEFACDEALLGRSKVEPRRYASCLIEAAQTALRRQGIPVCATGFFSGTERPLLTRRIEHMMQFQKIEKPGWSFRALVAALGVILAATAWASQGWVQDRRISMAEARKMMENAPPSEFPLTVNEDVVRELNRYLGTPEGREFIGQALQRMQAYKPLIEAKVREYGVPAELMAIPIVESGYQNLGASSQHPQWGAGLWMFIKSTAHKFGLRVDAEVDERLNETLLTDAALRYLKSNQLLFKDWPLAVLAYNMGEESVRKAQRKTGLHEAWALIHAGYENDRNYLAKVTAAILILRHPESVR